MKTGCESPLAVIESIGAAARVSAIRNSFRAWSSRLETLLAGSGRLILIDEVHKLIGYGNNKTLHVLRDLHDATGCPMVWLGTTEVVEHIRDGQAKGREPMDQLMSRIGLIQDLVEDTVVRCGGGGKPLATIEDIRKVFHDDTLRITPDALDYLHRMANRPLGGCYRTCRQVLAAAIYAARGKPITAELLMQAHDAKAGRAAAQVQRAEMRWGDRQGERVRAAAS
jgi:Bacterial TniB protein